MPDVPIEIPSLTPTVFDTNPTSFADRTLPFTSAARPFRCMLHGLPS